MIKKFNSRTSILVNTILLIPVLFVIYLDFKGLEFLPSLFYGFIMFILASMINRNMYWIHISGTELRIKYYSLFKRNQTVDLNHVQYVEFKEKNSLLERALHIGEQRFDHVYITSLNNDIKEIITLKSNFILNINELFNELEKVYRLNI
ncbi:YdbT family protein [Reichenbachiella versicolor]|uniref:hypothetical protein n=1 Tax=Reichenbachiella versicolor TaxID=1821036 RepID=UPI000D6E4AA7|nr:hypothetical protein [Reichenbachiella versicolor]